MSSIIRWSRLRRAINWLRVESGYPRLYTEAEARREMAEDRAMFERNDYLSMKTTCRLWGGGTTSQTLARPFPGQTQEEADQMIDCFRREAAGDWLDRWC